MTKTTDRQRLRLRFSAEMLLCHLRRTGQIVHGHKVMVGLMHLAAKGSKADSQLALVMLLRGLDSARSRTPRPP